MNLLIKCKKCEKDLSRDNYYSYANGKPKRRCKPCMKVIYVTKRTDEKIRKEKTYYQNNKEKLLTYQYEYNKKNRTRVLQYMKSYYHTVLKPNGNKLIISNIINVEVNSRENETTRCIVEPERLLS